MNAIILRNNTDKPLEIMFEPWATKCNLDPAEVLELEGDFSGADSTVELDINPDRLVSLWVPHDVTAKKNGNEFQPTIA